MKKNKNTRKNRKPFIPIFAKILLSVAILSFAVFFAARKSSDFAEWMTLNVGYFVRRALAFISGAIQFSLGEVLLILAPVMVIAVLVVAAKRKGLRSKIRFLSGFLAVLSIFYSMYVFTLGVGYHRTKLASGLEITSADITKESLVNTLVILKDKCELLLDEISYTDTGSSVSDMSFDQVCDDILRGYERLESDYPNLNIKTFDSRAKQVYFSNVMTSFEISGVYTFFTGESNVNVHYPDYGMPFTMAHELAHQRGIARENEANFVAFLACIRADSAYVKYSAYMNMFEYVASALSRTDKELFREIYSNADIRIKNEISAFNKFYYEHKNELMSKISDFMNDNYLKASGTEGIISYSLVVELCVAYYSG